MMLSQDFASALRDIRLQMQALVKDNEMLHKRIDDLTKQLDKSDDRVFKQQSQRIRQAAASNDLEALQSLNTGAISPLDAELIRLSTPVEAVQSVQVGTPNNGLLANFIAAARDRGIPVSPQTKLLPTNDNIQRINAQLRINNANMAEKARLQKEQQQRMNAIEAQRYKEQNNALGQRSPRWGEFNGEIIDY